MSRPTRIVTLKGHCIRWLVTIIGITLRYRIDDPAGIFAAARRAPHIFVFWHNRIFLMPHIFRKYWVRRLNRNRVAALVSRSSDGTLLADVLAAFGLRCVRGSSSRGGKAALRELTRLVDEGYDIGITPDGPRGPRYVLQPGCLNLAQLTGAAIIPISYDLAGKITFKSWDAFMVPLPFTRCEVRIGPAIRIDQNTSDLETEKRRQELETALRQLGD